VFCEVNVTESDLESKWPFVERRFWGVAMDQRYAEGLRPQLGADAGP